MPSRTILMTAVACVFAGAGAAWFALATRPAEVVAPVETSDEPADEHDEHDVDDEEGDPDAMQAKARICKKLTCTDNQRGELGTLIRTFRDNTRERRTELKNLRASVAQAWAAAEPDGVRIAELETRIAQTEVEIDASARHALLAFHRLLDDEQRRKLARWLRRKPARDLLTDRRQRGEEAETPG
jgi:Spy/CpxP family protein refolding chaperone